MYVQIRNGKGVEAKRQPITEGNQDYTPCEPRFEPTMHREEGQSIIQHMKENVNTKFKHLHSSGR